MPARQVRAHGGQLLRHAGLYWWVGTSRKVGAALCSTHVNLYSARGLDGGAEGWAHRGAVFDWRQIRGFPDLLPYGHLDHPPPPYRIERPKVGRRSRLAGWRARWAGGWRWRWRSTLGQRLGLGWCMGPASGCGPRRAP